MFSPCTIACHRCVGEIKEHKNSLRIPHSSKTRQPDHCLDTGVCICVLYNCWSDPASFPFSFNFICLLESVCYIGWLPCVSRIGGQSVVSLAERWVRLPIDPFHISAKLPLSVYENKCEREKEKGGKKLNEAKRCLLSHLCLCSYITLSCIICYLLAVPFLSWHISLLWRDASRLTCRQGASWEEWAAKVICHVDSASTAMLSITALSFSILLHHRLSHSSSSYIQRKR